MRRFIYLDPPLCELRRHTRDLRSLFANAFIWEFDNKKRYLRATKWASAKVAIERLEGTLKWRREYGIYDELTAELVEPEVSGSCFYLFITFLWFWLTLSLLFTALFSPWHDTTLTCFFVCVCGFTGCHGKDGHFWL